MIGVSQSYVISPSKPSTRRQPHVVEDEASRLAVFPVGYGLQYRSLKGIRKWWGLLSKDNFGPVKRGSFEMDIRVEVSSYKGGVMYLYAI